MISSVHILEDHSAPLKNPGYNAAQLPLTACRQKSRIVSELAAFADNNACHSDALRRRYGLTLSVAIALYPPYSLPQFHGGYCALLIIPR
jgi:hypothetical protein